MIYTREYNKMYNSIVKEFQPSGSMLVEMKIVIEALVKSRLDLCKLLKIEDAKAETLYLINLELIKYTTINECSIKEVKKKKLEILNEINERRQEIKVIKLHINKLEKELWQERQKSSKFREDFRVFVSREKFKIIKKYFVKNYKIIFAKYPNELSIKLEIEKCNERKDKIRQEKQKSTYVIERYNRKITNNKIKLAEMRKNIINMRKHIELFNMKILKINDYKVMEEKFKIKCKRID